MCKFAHYVLSSGVYFFYMAIAAKFTEHPNSVDETYFEHMAVASGFSRKLFKAAICCALHGVFPWMHCTTGSTTVKELYAEMTAGARANQDTTVAA